MLLLYLFITIHQYCNAQSDPPMKQNQKTLLNDCMYFIMYLYL